MRVNRFLVPLLVIVTLLGTTFIAQAAGFWSTSGKDSLDLENMSAADIKGWMTLQQVMDGLQVSQEELYAVGGIPLDAPPETALKDLEGVVPDFEISTLREKLPAPANPLEPAAPLEPTPLPQPTATPQLASTPVHTPAITDTHSGDGTGIGPTPLPPGQVLPADQIKGRMTLREVSDQCVVPLDQLLVALNLPLDTNPNVALKDLISQGTLSEVTPVKDAVAKLQAK
ncbi:hypothetical protein TFLX_03874 [Thermoflexales bacterium]|nr:hypothetical protein TFLX_03874 [Thermoflexales bacterium]